MNSNKQAVLAVHPGAKCEQSSYGSITGYVVYAEVGATAGIGSGKTRANAWEDAARRVRRLAKASGETGGEPMSRDMNAEQALAKAKELLGPTADVESYPWHELPQMRYRVGRKSSAGLMSPNLIGAGDSWESALESAKRKLSAPALDRVQTDS